ncbi:MAG: FAD-dependent oxidoreductase [Deltaproteobacteria bacterium]|nr:FAD-dependent oxidoreductase [Deltaproteobacteria bacterium]
MCDPIVVLGGGPCGLSAAWELADLGLPVRVIEKEWAPGGLCATVEQEGWRFDLGGHRFITSNEKLQHRVLTLMGDIFVEAERRSVVLAGGRRFRYPLEARDLAKNLGLFEGARAIAGWGSEVLRRPFARRDDRTFEGWVTARFGRPLYDRFFGPYTQKLWGMPPSEISGDWAAQRISLINLGDVALRLAGLRRSEVRTYARRYLYPRLGMGQMFARLATSLEDRDVGIDLGSEVTGLERMRDGRIGAVRFRCGSFECEVPCSAVISTIPLGTLVRHLRPEGDAELDVHARRLRFRALRFLNIRLDLPEVSENTWTYVSDRDVPVSRIQEPRNRSPEMAPAGRTSLMLEIPCEKGDRTWSADDAELLSEMLGHLRGLGFDLDRHVLGAASTWVEHGYPIYHLGYREDCEALLTEVDRFENVWTAGRQGLFRYIFMDAAMEMGIEAARQAATGRRGDRGRIYEHRREKQLLETQALTAA